ncbi:hypothetical protein VSH64_45030 [Amycolatopsis rhabdoformis]|uniref:Uncharacterized protein n=1 Tax=Amycolatopsis rhabdoformis TaxID=1448059 RepID=A0ABZ1I632_9PSEU|nr:hypothetical protein [Amycolatopsis rhabdoformis]WSE29881.1 hypothetical protein VSH64_45030 [Amycolatopsis rhabdoformis]
MLSTSRGSAAQDLLEYGEAATAEWVVSCSEDDFMKVCAAADWILLYGPTTPSGASMMVARAIASAAVFVHDGRPRDLARKRRRKLPELTPEERRRVAFDRAPDHRAQRAKGEFYGVTDELKEFWAADTGR